MINERSRPRTGKARAPEAPDALTISLMGSPASAGLARTFAQQQLYKWGYLHILDDALLITSELIANASEATPGKELRYRIERNPKGVLISVWDSSPRVPSPKPLTELTSKPSTTARTPSTPAAAGASPSSKPSPPPAATPSTPPVANGSGPASSPDQPCSTGRGKVKRARPAHQPTLFPGPSSCHAAQPRPRRHTARG